jgi:hypothetical protein
VPLREFLQPLRLSDEFLLDNTHYRVAEHWGDPLD